MSDGSLSQEEINALLAGGDNNPDASDVSNNGDNVDVATSDDSLTTQEMDTIGEVSNICMGTAATALFSLVNKKVEISTPVVSLSTWQNIIDEYEKPCVLVKIIYTKGLNGSNELVLKESDVRVITDLMMGGNGENVEGELTDIHLSAISEAMNQMMGSSATSVSSMLNKTVDISPPSAKLIRLETVENAGDLNEFLSGVFVKIEFKLQIGDLVDSKIMQLYPISLVRQMCSDVANTMESDADSNTPTTVDQEVGQVPQSEMQMGSLETDNQERNMPMGNNNEMQPNNINAQVSSGTNGMPISTGNNIPQREPINVQSANFAAFQNGNPVVPLQENIDLIKNVPLEVTVELGRTYKSIQEILDFAPGTIIELNKIAGEPIDVLVNGKYVAKGEVVVIEESFGIRITEILTN